MGQRFTEFQEGIGHRPGQGQPPRFDTLIKDVRIVRPGADDILRGDIAIAGGQFAAIAPDIAATEAREVHDGHGWLAFPGLVDAHMHAGIYRPLGQDAATESRAAAAGGVTTSLNYVRTGRYYLDRGGPLRDFFPEVLSQVERRFHVDYGFHLAPITGEHVGEMALMAREYGVPSFKIFMFYGSHGLHGRSGSQQDFLMLGEHDRYDVAHFERIMRELAGLWDSWPEGRDTLSLSLHCELGEILAAYTAMVERGEIRDATGRLLEGLPAYSASRPAHSEGLAIFIAAYLAHETGCPNINLLHLSSAKAIEAALMMRDLFPHVRFCREVTVGHLLLDTECAAGCLAKVNPPIRPRADVERLWAAVLAGDVDWIVSDHACCGEAEKVDSRRRGDIFAARSGFGGTEYLLAGVVTEGRRRGLGYNRIAELLSAAPARRFGLPTKGDIEVGRDADLALFDDRSSFIVRADDSPSAQGYSPFEGLEMAGRVRATYLRGRKVFADGVALGPPQGQFLRRPTRLQAPRPGAREALR